jgi:hypothetical protein
MKNLPKAMCSVTTTAVAPIPKAFKPGALAATMRMVPQFPVAALGRSGPSIVIVAQKPPCTWFGGLWTTVVAGGGFA